MPLRNTKTEFELILTNIAKKTWKDRKLHAKQTLRQLEFVTQVSDGYYT